MGPESGAPPLRPRELHSEVDALLVPEGGLADDASELQVSSSQPVPLQSLMSVFKAGLVMYAFHAVVLRSEDPDMEAFYDEDHNVADAWVCCEDPMGLRGVEHTKMFSYCRRRGLGLGGRGLKNSWAFGTSNQNFEHLKNSLVFRPPRPGRLQ